MDNMELNQSDLKDIRTKIDEKKNIRNRIDPETLRIIVDGYEVGRFEPAITGGFEFDIDDSPGMIEIRTGLEEGNILIATHLPDYFTLQRASGPIEYVTVLGQGQKVSFRVSPLESWNEEVTKLRLSVVYRETDFARAARLEWRRMKSYIGSLQLSPKIKGAFTPVTVAAVAIFMVTSGAFWMYFYQDSRPSDSMIAMEHEKSRDISINRPPERLDQPGSLPEKTEREKPSVVNAAPPVVRTVKPKKVELFPNVNTRSVDGSTAGIKLIDINKVLVQIETENPDGPLFARLLEAKMETSIKWTPAGDDLADAAIRLWVNQAGDTVKVRVIDDSENIIWPLGSAASREYRGTPEEIVDRILLDIKKDLDTTRR